MMSDTKHALPAGAHPSKSDKSEQTEAARSTPGGRGLFSTEDWWAVWIGLLGVVVALALFASGGSIKWLAVAPAKWTRVAQAVHDVGVHVPNYLALFVVFAVLFGIG